MSGSGLVDRLAAHTRALSYEDLSEGAREALKTFVLDSLGVGIAGSSVPFAPSLLALCNDWGGSGRARVLGTGASLSASQAALINGWQIHNQEFDCVHEPAVVHPMATILAALLAHADAVGGVRGRDFMLALAIAVDTATLLGESARSPLRFFRPAVCGALGASLGLARLRGLDDDAIRDALGIAYSQASGTMQAHLEGSPVLALQIGFNARNAVVAADLAAAGLRAPHDVLEGPFGFFALFEPEQASEQVFRQLGQVSQIERVSHKPFPSGRASHGGLDALQTLSARHSFAAEDIQSLRLEAPPLIHHLVGRPARDGMSESYARLCFGYAAACMLLDGRVDVDSYRPDALAEGKRLALASTCEVAINHVSDPNAMVPQTLSITLRDGRMLVEPVEAVLGSPERPLSRAQHLEKFTRCAAAGALPLLAERIHTIVDAVDQLEQLADMRDLVNLCVSN